MKDQPSLTELRALAAIARHRSFRTAADELEMAASTISHMMSGLQTRLGMRLLNRTTRSVSPTPAAERLVSCVVSILHELDDALAQVDAERERPSSLLRLTASETVAMLLVQTVIPAFLQQYPEMTVDLVAQHAGFMLGEALPQHGRRAVQ